MHITSQRPLGTQGCETSRREATIDAPEVEQESPVSHPSLPRPLLSNRFLLLLMLFCFFFLNHQNLPNLEVSSHISVRKWWAGQLQKKLEVWRRWARRRGKEAGGRMPCPARPVGALPEPPRSRGSPLSHRELQERYFLKVFESSDPSPDGYLHNLFPSRNADWSYL